MSAELIMVAAALRTGGGITHDRQAATVLIDPSETPIWANRLLTALRVDDLLGAVRGHRHSTGSHLA